MKIEENSYYIHYNINKGVEYANMSHYKDVWDNGYTVINIFTDAVAKSGCLRR